MSEDKLSVEHLEANMEKGPVVGEIAQSLEGSGDEIHRTRMIQNSVLVLKKFRQAEQ